MFTVNRLGLSPSLCRGLVTTNIIESSIGGCPPQAETGRVTNWQDGSMVKRWAATALLEAALKEDVDVEEKVA